MKSYVRESINATVSVWEHKRRRDVVRGVVSLRLTSERLDVLRRVAAHFKISRTGAAEMLLEEAIIDAAEELGLWQQPQDNFGSEDDQKEN